MDIFDVVLATQAKRDLLKIPPYIAKKLHSWVDDIAHYGLREARKTPGYHDEPLHGQRMGERSIRLSKSYRAIYRIEETNAVEIINILEVNKHDY